MTTTDIPAADTGLPEINRRALLRAAPFAAIVASMPALAGGAEADPVLLLYREWLAAHAAHREACEGEPAYSDVAAHRAWDERQLAAVLAECECEEAVAAATPTTLAGIAASAHVLWDQLDVACLARGSDRYIKACADPQAALCAAIWRAASGRAGTPDDMESAHAA